MTKSDQAEAAAVAIAPAAVLASAFLKGAAMWVHSQGEVLSAMEAVMADWIGRRREAFDMWSQSLEEMYECREPIDFIRVQQDWLCDAVRLTACEIRVLAGDSAALTRKAAAGLDKTVGRPTDDILETRRGKPQTSGSQPVERAAAD